MNYKKGDILKSKEYGSYRVILEKIGVINFISQRFKHWDEPFEDDILVRKMSGIYLSDEELDRSFTIVTL